MRFLTNRSTDPYYNMAFDQYCLEQAVSDAPVFYLWRNRPSVIIGLNQNAYSEVNRPYLEEHGICLARRVTGGGAVYHDLQNLNYTIVGRSNDLERDHAGYLHLFSEALRSLGVDAEVSGRNDILVDGRKVSGYAKRVWRDRLMIHGTLMYDVDIEALTAALSAPGSKLEAKGIASVKSRVANLKSLLPQYDSLDSLQAALQEILADGDGEVLLSEAQKDGISALAKEKFSTWEWNWGRSPQASLERSAKLGCGSVEARITIEHGMISGLEFGGDFLGNLPASELAGALRGCRYESGAIARALETIDTGSYFDDTTADQIAALLI